MFRRFLIAALFLAPCGLRAGDYLITKKTALSSAAEVITVQLPASTSKTVAFVGASVYCSVACSDVTLERDGTAATGTAGSAQSINSADPNPAATAYYSSNVGAGTEIGRYVVAAGSILSIDLARKGLTKGQNLTIRTPSISGTVIIQIQWREP